MKNVLASGLRHVARIIYLVMRTGGAKTLRAVTPAPSYVATCGKFGPNLDVTALARRISLVFRQRQLQKKVREESRVPSTELALAAAWGHAVSQPLSKSAAIHCRKYLATGQNKLSQGNRSSLCHYDK